MIAVAMPREFCGGYPIVHSTVLIKFTSCELPFMMFVTFLFVPWAVTAQMLACLL